MHPVESPGAELFWATVALHDELAALELDIAELPDAKQPADVKDHFARRWQEQHDKLALFFDLDVYLDPPPVAQLNESPHCAGVNPRIPLREAPRS